MRIPFSLQIFVNPYNLTQLPMNYSWFDRDENPEKHYLEEEDLQAPFQFALCIPANFIDNFILDLPTAEEVAALASQH